MRATLKTERVRLLVNVRS